MSLSLREVTIPTNFSDLHQVSTTDVISHDRLLGLVSYCKETGVFTRNQAFSHFGKSYPAGSMVGTRCGRYYSIKLDRRMYKAHNLAFFYVTGKWPEVYMDHIDCDGFNNAWSNLREATASQNRQNTAKYVSNTSGHKGITWLPRVQKWQARCAVNGVRHFVGVFSDLEEAVKAREEFAKQYHGEFYHA